MEGVLIIGGVLLMLSLGMIGVVKYGLDLYRHGTLIGFWAGAFFSALAFTFVIWDVYPQMMYWWDWLLCSGAGVMAAAFAMVLVHFVDKAARWCVK